MDFNPYLKPSCENPGFFSILKQNNRPNIYCDGEKLENVFRFKYLGTIFTVDTKQKYDLKTKVSQSFTHCGELRNVIDAPNLSTELKLHLYKDAVCSILTCGCETWRLTPPVMRQINDANSRTGKTIPQEARPITCSYNLCQAIRKRWLKWLGDILWNRPNRSTYQSIKEQRILGLPDNLLMDVPPPLVHWKICRLKLRTAPNGGYWLPQSREWKHDSTLRLEKTWYNSTWSIRGSPNDIRSINQLSHMKRWKESVL